LVVIAVVLFVAGGAIAFGSVISGSKNKSSNTTVISATTTPVVVATAKIAAGTSGAEMVSQGLVTIQNVPAKNYVATDLTSLTGLTDEVLSTSVAKGLAVQTTDISPSTSAVPQIPGMDNITITVSGVDGLAGYLQQGDRVDVYANVVKVSTPQTGQGLPAGVALPCTELTMTNIEVLDVSSTSPAYTAKDGTTGRTLPGSQTLLLAVTPAQSQALTFFTQNETLSVVQTQKDTFPPAIGVCKGTGQYTIAP
jgi:Flp pilus assembly protein CpaB